MSLTAEQVAFKPKRALISVSDKTGIVELARVLHQQKIDLIATGNTAQLLNQHEIPTTEVSSCTGFPEMLNGRVKTLHPAIHAGLLARGKQDDKVLAQHDVKPIDLLIVNLYPFTQVIGDPDCSFDKAIENIDIGGPAMIRSAAKNHAHRYVVVSPDDYSELIAHIKTKKAPADWQLTLAKKAFAHTAAYDAAISNYLGTLDENLVPNNFPTTLTCQYEKATDLRYGENPHQHAIFYKEKNAAPGTLAKAELLQGKPLSYNNLLDADAALNCAKSFAISTPICVIVKHTNPCGVALGANNLTAYDRAFAADPASAFGGIIAFNQILDVATVKAILAKQFVEVIIAPKVEKGVIEVLQQKPNIRLLITDFWPEEPPVYLSKRQIDGGLLVQENDNIPLSRYEFNAVTEKKPSETEFQDLLFAWQVVKHVKSNAIVYAKNQGTLGIGAGQTSRVMSARIGLWQAQQAGFKTAGAVMASDAFIPFPDSLELAANAGITAVIQPGGSVKDPEIIQCANRFGISMLFTGIRHFKH